MSKPSRSFLSRALARSLSVVSLLVTLGALEAGAQPLNSEGIQPNEVKQGVAAENAKLDLTMCAPEVEVLSKASADRAAAEVAQNPECRRAIVRAEEAGLTRSQIVDIIMSSSGVPDPDPGPPGTGDDGDDGDDE
jgi:hypothetical protein